jgi:hypothetical protein
VGIVNSVQARIPGADLLGVRIDGTVLSIPDLPIRVAPSSTGDLPAVSAAGPDSPAVARLGPRFPLPAEEPAPKAQAAAARTGGEANLRYGYDGSELRRLHKRRLGCVLDQRKVRSGLVILRQRQTYVPIQRGFAEHDHVIQALSPDGADDALHVGTLQA